MCLLFLKHSVNREPLTREQSWRENFEWANGGTHIIGLTAIGRGTVIALRLNNEDIVEARTIWISLNWHPPSV
ncbi:MAG: hypothetical protein RLZZ338_3629 [Cyanobacteriota bacterium]|jgi:hypothetical protein